VERGLDDPPASPFRDAFGGWVLGSERFLARLRTLAGSTQSHPPVAEARQLSGLDPKRIFAAVTSFYGLDDAALSRRHDPHVARAVAAWLCGRHTEASLRELAASLGLSRPDSVPNLTRRFETRLKTSPELSNDLAEILKLASSADVGATQDNAKRTKALPNSARPKTKNQGHREAATPRSRHLGRDRYSQRPPDVDGMARWSARPYDTLPEVRKANGSSTRNIRRVLRLSSFP
jgi:hypothetical protein